MAGLRFRRLNLLDLAFCHRSFVNETTENIDNNERLEFLGDSVLGIVVADYLFRLLPDRPEGDLARIKSHVVSEDALAEIALELGINSIVHVGKGEELSGGRTKKALLSDCMEALIGAWYLDAGYEKAARFILYYLKDPIDTVLANKHRKDYKTLLQEIVQKRFHSYPKYVLERKTGPDHQRTFCYIDDAVKIMRILAEAETSVGEAFNIGNETPEITIKSLAEKILKIAESNLVIKAGPVTEGSPGRRCPDMSKTIKTTGYTPVVSLEEGLRRTFLWYKNNVFLNNGDSAV